MLDLLRKNATGPLGIALIILLVFAFSIWGVGDIFRGFNANILAKIGNRELNSQSYLFNFNREVSRISNQLERAVTTEEAVNSGLHYQILDRSLVELSANASSDERHQTLLAIQKCENKTRCLPKRRVAEVLSRISGAR